MNDKYLEYCIKVRRDIHMYPETGYDINRTIDYIATELDKLNIKYYKNIGISSLVAVLEGDGSGPVIGIRADVDALDIVEMNDVPFKSIIDGKMHACGHDCHGAILLTTLKYIVEEKISFNGTVKAIFQAAEEGPTSGGAKVCLDSIMDDVDCFFAIHMSPTYETGKIKIKPLEFNASCDDFTIKMIGRSGHAAYPHMAIDPIQMANEVYMLIQTMKARELKQVEKSVISIAMMSGGNTFNVIPEYCIMKGTVRTYSKELKKEIKVKLENIVKSVSLLHGGNYEFNYSDECIALINTPEVCDFLIDIVKESIGEEYLVLDGEYSMGVDDFAYYVDKSKGAMFYLGCKNEKEGKIASLHNCYFNPDEKSFLNGIKLYVEIIKQYGKR